MLHGCCHNPTGADLNPEQWGQVCATAHRNGFIPFIDIAYQGLGNGLELDAYGIRELASQLPELILASSCSKNFGLYRERTGAISFICNDSDQTEIVLSHAMSSARSLYSMPPAHGALLVSSVLGDPKLREEWEIELESVRLRIQLMRDLLCEKLQDNNKRKRFFSYQASERNVFIFGYIVGRSSHFKEKYGIYMVGSTRINLAGININNIDYLSECILKVI